MRARYKPGDDITQARVTEIYGVTFEAAVWTNIDALSDDEKLMLMGHPMFVVDDTKAKAAAP